MAAFNDSARKSEISQCVSVHSIQNLSLSLSAIPFMSKTLREEMPGVSYFIDAMRELLGKEFVNDQIRRGMQGEPTFFASENGHAIGTRTSQGSQFAVAWDDLGVSFAVEVKPGISIWDDIEKTSALRQSQPRPIGAPISTSRDPGSTII